MLDIKKIRNNSDEILKSLSKKDKEHKGRKIVWSKAATEQKYFGKKGKPNKLTKITRWN